MHALVEYLVLLDALLSAMSCFSGAPRPRPRWGEPYVSSHPTSLSPGSVSIRQHTPAYVRQQTSAYVSIRQHTSAYVSIRVVCRVCVHSPHSYRRALVLPSVADVQLLQ
jgi:hypothetical protein